MKNLIGSMIIASILFGTSNLIAQDNSQRVSPRDSEWLKNTWTIEVGFGEIPFVSGSFKPSISFGHYFNQYLYVGWIVQCRDIIERGKESFNARNTSLGHIEATREVTGIRSLIGARIRPHRYAPYLSVGLLFNGSDREEMRFGSSSRTIGGSTYEGSVAVVQTRPWGIRPAVGIGYSVQLQNGFTISAEMTGAFFLPAPPPDIVLEHETGISDEDLKIFTAQTRKAFKINFHNRYHLFNIGAGYVW